MSASVSANRPGATKCHACGFIFPYQTMIKVKRRWYCTKKSNDNVKDGCKERLEKYNIWPPE